MKKGIVLLIMLMLMGCGTVSDGTVASDTENKSDVSACSLDNPCESEETEVIDTKDGLTWDIITLEESFDHLDETVILFYSFVDCPYCKEAIPVLDDVIKDEDVKIYYVEVLRDERTEGNENYDRLYEYLKDELSKENLDKIYMPTAVFIKDGELKGIHVGTVATHKAREAAMTDEEIAELSKIYTDLLETVK